MQPYLDDAFYTALVMQGQSANYKTSEAASQAMDESLPDVVKRILRAIIKADCCKYQGVRVVENLSIIVFRL